MELDKKIEELEEDSEKKRELKGFWAKMVAVLATGTTLFHILALTVFPLDPWIFLSCSTGMFSILTFLLFPMFPGGKKQVQAIDVLFCLTMVGIMGYIFLNYEEMYYRVGFEPTSGDVVCGVLLTVLVLEMVRRLMGWVLPIICLVFLSYVLFGADLPGIFGHKGYSLGRLVSVLSSTEGIYGTAMTAAATYIVLFVTFGAFLRNIWLGQFFITLAMSVAGVARGGPAKVSIFASALFGMISGSSTGNVATVGTFTIPLMKHTGYTARFAGAVEATASTGGQLMPPVMGAAAFVLAEATMTPYRNVCMAALIPAFCYFASVYFMIDFEAARLGLRGLSKSELPSAKKVLREDGLFLVPILLLIFMITFIGRSVLFSALVCIAVGIAVSWIKTRRWMGWANFFKSLQEGTLGTLQPAGACAAAGIIIGIFTLTGLGQRLVVLILGYGGDSLILSLVMIMCITVALGMGLPTVPAYILTAAVGAPVLVQQGVPVLAAHLFVMYYATVSTITPPVAMAAYCAAGIAKANPNQTGWQALRLGIASFVIPFMFVYNPGNLGIGTWPEILIAFVTSMLGAWALGMLANGHYRWSLRLLAGCAVIPLMSSSWVWQPFGVLMLLGAIGINRVLPGREASSSAA